MTVSGVYVKISIRGTRAFFKNKINSVFIYFIIQTLTLSNIECCIDA